MESKFKNSIKPDADFIKRLKKVGKIIQLSRQIKMTGETSILNTNNEKHLSLRMYHQQLYAHLLIILDGMDTFVQEYSLSKLTQKEIEHLSLKRIN